MPYGTEKLEADSVVADQESFSEEGQLDEFEEKVLQGWEEKEEKLAASFPDGRLPSGLAEKFLKLKEKAIELFSFSKLKLAGLSVLAAFMLDAEVSRSQTIDFPGADSTFHAYIEAANYLSDHKDSLMSGGHRQRLARFLELVSGDSAVDVDLLVEEQVRKINVLNIQLLSVFAFEDSVEEHGGSLFTTGFYVKGQDRALIPTGFMDRDEVEEASPGDPADRLLAGIRTLEHEAGHITDLPILPWVKRYVIRYYEENGIDYDSTRAIGFGRLTREYMLSPGELLRFTQELRKLDLEERKESSRYAAYIEICGLTEKQINHLIDTLPY